MTEPTESLLPPETARATTRGPVRRAPTRAPARRAAILFDGISALGPSPELAILDTVDAIERVFADDGWRVTRVPVNPDAAWVERVRKGRFDLVFNLCEGVDGASAMEPAVIGALELMGIPFTGSSSWTAALCLRKPLANELALQAGIPVPRFATVRAGDPLPRVGYPAICKPAAEDASLGIEQRSVVRTPREMRARLDAMLEQWDEIVVQRFVDGREVNVGIVGDEVLPIAEIDFGRMPRDLWRIVSFRSKWEEGSDEDLGAAPRCPARLSRALELELAELARRAWRLVGGAGYGRCDFRIDDDGRPWLLEINANPDLAPDAGLARMATVAGLDYAGLVRRVCRAALAARPAPRETDDAHWSRAQELSGVVPAEPALADLVEGRRA